MKTTGIIGTAKNTGKTTTLSYFLKSHSDDKIAVTGIGYDGEEIDNITLLPKPRLFFEKSIIVATAELCLKNTEAKFIILKKTDITTSLGNVFIVEVTEPGLIVIAGPNRVSYLKKLISHIEDFNVNQLFVDGSLNRLSPMFLLDNLIFTTGGSRNTNIDILVEEMQAVEKIFSYPKSSEPRNDFSSITFFCNEISLPLSINSLFDSEDVELLKNEFSEKITTIFFPSFISYHPFISLIEFINKKFDYIPEILLYSPIQLLLSCDFSLLNTLIERMEKLNIKISYKSKPNLQAITINPFFPKLYNFNYVPDYLDKKLFIKKMKEKLTTSVFNVQDEFLLVSNQ